MGVGQAALFSQRSPSRGALGRSPETYQQAGLRGGDRHLNFLRDPGQRPRAVARLHSGAP